MTLVLWLLSSSFSSVSSLALSPFPSSSSSSSSVPLLRLDSLQKSISLDRRPIGFGNYGLVYRATLLDPSTNVLTSVVAKRALSSVHDGVSLSRESRCRHYLDQEELINRHVVRERQQERQRRRRRSFGDRRPHQSGGDQGRGEEDQEEEDDQEQNVVPFLGSDTMPDDKQKYLFFRYVDGPGTLKDVRSLSALRSILHPPASPFDPPATQSDLHSFLDELLSLLLSSLVPLHDVGVVHRDFKPENILVGPSTSSLFLIDFGSARDVFSPALISSGSSSSSSSSPPVLSSSSVPVSLKSLVSSSSSAVSSLLRRLLPESRRRSSPGVLFPASEDVVAVTPTFAAPELHEDARRPAARRDSSLSSSSSSSSSSSPRVAAAAVPQAFDVFSAGLVFFSYVFDCSSDDLLLSSHRSCLERHSFDLRSWSAASLRQTVLPAGILRGRAYLDRHCGRTWDLLQAMLSPNPEDRPTARDARDIVNKWRAEDKKASKEGSERRPQPQPQLQSPAVPLPSLRAAKSVGKCSVPGLGAPNEDAVLLKTYGACAPSTTDPSLPPPSTSSSAAAPAGLAVVGGVFDGHAGPDAANFLAANLAGLLERRLADAGKGRGEEGDEDITEDGLRAAMYGAWDDAVNTYRARDNAEAAGGDDASAGGEDSDLDADQQQLQPKGASIASRSMSSGATACVAVLWSEQRIRADKPVGAILNCGDSRGIVFRKDRLLLSTVDHVPGTSSKDGAKGWEKRLPVRLRDESDWLYDITRALEAEDVERAGISSQPDIFMLPPSLVEKGDVILLATDGCWDYVGNSDAMAIVNDALAKGATASAVAEAVTTAAKERGAKAENVSVVVIVV